MGESRTKKNLRNSIVAMSFFAVEFILKFYSRKIFLVYLGTEILGLNTTAVNLLQFLNLAEMGIVSAVGFSLYKPLRENDRNQVNEIVTLQGQFYKRIAWAVIAGGIMLMCFFPRIFHKMELPMWYAYGTFAALMYSALLGYFVNYKQIVLASAQMDYKISLSTRTWNIVMLLCQMLAVSQFPHPYVWWLAIQVLYSSIGAVSLHLTTMRSFPWLKKTMLPFKELRDKHKILISKIKQLFVHKLAGVALTQTSPLIIYAYLSLTTVTYYGNYQLITAGISSLLTAVFNSMGAGVGDLIAEGNKRRIYKVFEELMSIRIYIGVTMAYAMMTLGQPFVSIWVGKEYLLPYSTLGIITAIMYIVCTRNAVEVFLFGYGIFRDIWAPVAEAVLNLGLSLLLGYYFGLNGILLGVLTSLVVIVFLWKPTLLYMDGFNRSVADYFLLYAKHMGIAAIAWVLSWWIMSHWIHDPYSDWMNLILYGISSMTVFCLLFAVGLATLPGFRTFLRRIAKKNGNP